MRTISIWILVGTAVVSGGVWAIARSWGKGDSAMKTAWTVLLIKAAIAFAFAFQGGWQAARALAGPDKWPSLPMIADAAFWGLLAAGFIVREVLGSSTAESARLQGIDVVSITKMPGVTEVVGPAAPGQVERSAQNVMPPTVGPTLPVSRRP